MNLHIIVLDSIYNIYIYRLIDSLIDWLIEWLSDWVIEWLIDWLSDWLTGWFDRLMILAMKSPAPGCTYNQMESCLTYTMEPTMLDRPLIDHGILGLYYNL